MPPVAQTVARQCPRAVNTVGANNLPKPHRHGSWGSHTRAQDAVFTGTRHTRPTKTPAFPHQQAENSPQNQHVLSILIVGPNQLKHRLSRTSKPETSYTTTTFCLSSTLALTAFNSDFPAQQSRKVAIKPTRFVHPHSWSQPTSIPIFPHQKAENSPQNQHVLSYNPGAPGRTARREATDPLGELITDKQKRRGANLTVDPSAYPINTVHVRPNSSSEDSRRRGHYGRRRLSLYASTVGSQPCQNDNTT